MLLVILGADLSLCVCAGCYLFVVYTAAQKTRVIGHESKSFLCSLARNFAKRRSILKILSPSDAAIDL